MSLHACFGAGVTVCLPLSHPLCPVPGDLPCQSHAACLIPQRLELPQPSGILVSPAAGPSTLPCGGRGGGQGMAVSGTAGLGAAGLCPIASARGAQGSRAPGSAVRGCSLSGTDPLHPGLLAVLSGVLWQPLPPHVCAVPARDMPFSYSSPGPMAFSEGCGAFPQAPWPLLDSVASLRLHGFPQAPWSLLDSVASLRPHGFPQAPCPPPCSMPSLVPHSFPQGSGPFPLTPVARSPSLYPVSPGQPPHPHACSRRTSPLCPGLCYSWCLSDYPACPPAGGWFFWEMWE